MKIADKTDKDEITAPNYIRANFHPSDRLAVLVRNRKWGETVQRISTAEKIAGPQFQAWLQYKNEKDVCDVYIGMNALKPEAHTRTKDDIQNIRHLYVDLDHEGPARLEAIEHSDLVPGPSYVLNTSLDKYQVIWKVDGITLEQAEALQRAVVREFGGDPAATDSTRVLRLPGFNNTKYEQSFFVKVQSHFDRTYHLPDFKLRAEPVNTDYQRLNKSPQKLASSSPRPLSQSEHDWAYAKRALARGVALEDVIRNIADFRAKDKHAPDDYARRTVMKAQAELVRDSHGAGTYRVAKPSRAQPDKSER